jgi:hypothetical protein
MSDRQVTCGWHTMTALQRKKQILEVAENYARGLRELTGKDVEMHLSFAPHANCQDGVALFTIEVEL